jgi:tetratricopeptide (TPR) repeat protein
VSSRETRAVASRSPLAVRETQLIDRAEEMRLLKEAVDRAVRGQGGIVFLYGEAGIGKTRLTKELAAYARLLGMRVLSGRCPALFRMDGVPPYILWKEVVKDYLETCTPEQLYKVIGNYPVEVSKLVPELKQMLRAMPESFPLSPENSRDRLFEAVSELVTNISRETPLLVILDDLQWTDESSLLLLHYLARGVYKESLLLLGAYRDTDVDERHPLIPVLTELNRERLLQSVQIKRMSLDDTSEMIKRILEQDDVSREFCELIYERTRGNPFFVEEVIKNLKEEEVIYREDDKWKIKEVSKIEFPETVKSVIKKRVSRLDDECQNILTLASFIGNDFTFEALQGVTGIEENKLLELVEKVLKTGLVKETTIRGEDMFCFGDVIVRDVVHEEVSHLRHRKLHSSVGNALEKVYAEKIDEHLGELAYHFLEGGEKARALDYFLKAGEKAAGIYANAEAASYFQSALGLLEEREGALQEKGSVLERLGDIKGFVGEHDTCLKYWNDAITLQKQLGDKESVSRLYRKMANALWEDVGDIEKAKENYEKALKTLEGEPEKVELASLYEDMAHMHYRTQDIPKALSLANKALELAKKLNAYDVIASSYASLGTVFDMAGDKKKACECDERALKIALDNGYMETALREYNNLPLALPPEEQHEKALEYCEKGYELAKKVGGIRYRSWIGIQLAGRYFGMGNVAKAMASVEDSVVLDTRTGNLPNLALSKGFMGAALFLVGEWDKGEKYEQEALSLAQKLKQWQQESSNYYWLGWMHFCKEEYDKALEFLEKANEVCEKAGSEYSKMTNSSLLIQTYLEVGKIEEAEKLVGNYGKFALESKNAQQMALADSSSGMLFRAQKRWKESLQLFERSLQEFEALNARQWDVYNIARNGLYEYARVYLDRNQEGDREKALDLLNQALEIFQKIGAKKDIENTESRILYAETGRLTTPKPKPASTPEQAPSVISTGYPDLDSLLFGGIPQDYAVILTSPSCNEKDYLIKSFLETGAKNGESTFYVTIDLSSAIKSITNRFQSSFHLFVCNPQADAIVESLPNVYKLKGVENLTDISIALTTAIRKLDPSQKRRRICLGLISDILLQHHAVQTRRWLTGLIPELRSEGFTMLAVMDPEMHAPPEARAVLDLFEGEINIQEKETEQGLRKYLKIKKMINCKYLENEVLLKKEEQK